MTAPSRTGGQILVDQLLIHGVDHIFCVPGESYLAALDALHDASIDVTVCRQEGGAAMMAEAYGKLTGRPGICFVTRGPGATNASPGIHIAKQDSTPMILFVGQIERGMREREAFQELDYRAAFGPLAKWATEVDDPARFPEIVSRAFHVATSGRPGPGRDRAAGRCAHRDGRGRRRAALPDRRDASGPDADGGAAEAAARCQESRSRCSAAAAGPRSRCSASNASRNASNCRSPAPSAVRCCFPPITRPISAISGSA